MRGFFARAGTSGPGHRGVAASAALAALAALLAGPLAGSLAGQQPQTAAGRAAALAAAHTRLTETRAAAPRRVVQCQKCHADRQFLVGKTRSERGDSALFVPDTLLRDSRHTTLVCADCHVGYNDGYPHNTNTVSVSCRECHQQEGDAWDRSVHAANFKDQNKGDAPTCVSCHSSHRVLGVDDPRSPTYALNVARLCGSCHNKRKILDAYFQHPADSTARTAVAKYRESVHGVAMTKAGLVVSATCNDCHDAHQVLPSDSSRSTISRAHVTTTCGSCHAGVLATLDSSSHGKALATGDTTESGHKAPVCIDCHAGHKIVAASDPVWFRGVVRECGACHERLLDTYFETYHGKVTELGFGLTAKCSDCHTAHAMLPAKDPRSTVNRANLVQTCGQCHADANAKFVQYMPHGDPQDRARNPGLFWVWAFMTALLVGVFGFFGVHTLLWLMRLALDRLRGRNGDDDGAAGPPDTSIAAEAPPNETRREPEEVAAGEER